MCFLVCFCCFLGCRGLYFVFVFVLCCCRDFHHSKFIDDFNVVHDNQFGFRGNKSTYMALNVLLDKFHESVTSKEYMIGLFMDLSRSCI